LTLRPIAPHPIQLKKFRAHPVQLKNFAKSVT
jgi:hypothetical protein